MFDEDYDRTNVLERYRYFSDETGGEPMVAAILTLSMYLRDAAWTANPTDSDGILQVELRGGIQTTAQT